MSEKLILTTADYVIICIMLAVSATMGIYFRIFGGKQKTSDEYLLAGKNMSILPVSISLMATFMSSTTHMGIPTEMYLFGTNMVFMNVGFIIGSIIASHLFLPIYFNTGASTAYEYLERRFGKSTRRLLSVIYLLQNVLFNGVTLYGPALALNAVTNLSMWTSVICIGVVCTFYCTLGGLKAVLWTDVFQSSLMYICILAVIIKGCLDLGGITNIFNAAYDGGRILLPTVEMDFSVRYTMWNVLLQGMIITIQCFGGSQTQVQRLLTLKNIKRSKMASLLSIPLIVIFHLLCCFCGLIFYVYFKSCDPLTSISRPIFAPDQLMPYYINVAMREYTGLPGLCIAGIFSTCLSTMSSSVNSMAAVTSEDIIRPLWPNLTGAIFIAKTASIFYGALSIVITFVVASMGNLVKATVLVMGMVAGPTLGVYLLAALTTTANEAGVNLGVLSGFLFGLIVTFAPNARFYPTLPFENNCSEVFVRSTNISAVHNSYPPMNATDFLTKANKHESDLPDNFPVSFMWIAPMSLLVCVVTGYISSWIISFARGTSEMIPLELLSPVQRWLYKKHLKVELDPSEKEISKSRETVKLTELQTF